MENKEIKVLDKLDDLARNYDFDYQSDTYPCQLPENNHFITQAKTILKEYSKDNAILFGQWIGENGYSQIYKNDIRWHDFHYNLIAKTTEELYNLFLADQNK